MALQNHPLDVGTYERILEISRRILSQMNLERLLDIYHPDGPASMSLPA